MIGRVWRQVVDDDLSLIAAGLAFYGALALFPALTALVALYGLAFDPVEVAGQLASFGGVLPQEVREILLDQLALLTADTPDTHIGVGLGFSALLLLWSASTGIQNLIRGVNLAFNETEHRSFWVRRIFALLLTVNAIFLFAVALAVITVGPAVLRFFGLSSGLEAGLTWLRWPLLAGVIYLGVAMVYRMAPNRRGRRHRWLSPGAISASALWLLASSLFSLYVANFGRYHATYGALGAVVVLLLWLYLGAFIVLLGAEIDSEIAAMRTDKAAATSAAATHDAELVSADKPS